jgi:hypothetical protein
MKKLLLSVIAFSLILTSCYKKDFKNLNTRLDALSAQVAGVATLAAGITTLQTQLTSLQAAVAAIPNNTAAITALQTGLTSLTTTVNGISTSLTALATAVATGNTTTQGLINALTTQVAANQTAINAALAAISSAIASGQAANTAAFTAINTALAAIQATQATQTASLANITSQNAALTALVNALTTNLAIANLNIQILLQNSQFYEGTLTIFDEATLAFAETLLNRIALIKGNVTVLTGALSAGQMTRLDVVAGKMISIIGSFTFTGATTNFTQLASVSGDVTVTATASMGLAALKSVGGNYSVSGKDINDAGLTSVLGNFSLNYDGPYSGTSLTSVGGTVTLTNFTTGGGQVGTTTVDFPALTSAGTVNAGTPSWTHATKVDLGAGMLTTLTAARATTIRLGQAVYTGTLTLTIGGSIAGGAAINLAGLDSTTGTLTVTGNTGSTVDLSNYRNGAGGNLDLSAGFAALSVPKYSYGTITGTGVKTLTAPLYRMSSTKAGAATDFAGLTILENLTVGAAEYGLFSAGVANTIKTINYTANGVNAEMYITTAETALTTVTVGGNFSMTAAPGVAFTNGAFGGVALESLSALTSVTTSGVINNFIVSSCSATGFTSMSLAHTHKVGGPGSYVWVRLNTKLTGLTTSTDFLQSLRVTGNTAMATIELGSYVSTVLGGAIEVDINGNKTSGTYTPTVVGTATTARVDCKYTATSGYMSQMKTYLSKFTGVPFAPATATTAATAVFGIDIDDVVPGAGVGTLDAAMTADAGIAIANAFNTFGYAANVAGSFVNTPTELIKFQ